MTNLPWREWYEEALAQLRGLELGARFQRFRVRFNELTLREKVGIIGLSFTVLLVGWSKFVLIPINEQRLQTRIQVNEKEFRLQALESQMNELGPQMSASIDKRERELDALHRKEAHLQGLLEQYLTGLVMPETMIAELGSLLQEEGNLTLVSMNNLPARYLDSLTDGLVRPGDRKDAEGNLASISDSMSIYLHGLEMTFEGNFLDALHYLRRLESLENHFIWKDLSLRVLKYPKARIDVHVETLGTEEGWLGV